MGVEELRWPARRFPPSSDLCEIELDDLAGEFRLFCLICNEPVALERSIRYLNQAIAAWYQHVELMRDRSIGGDPAHERDTKIPLGELRLDPIQFRRAGELIDSQVRLLGKTYARAHDYVMGNELTDDNREWVLNG